MIGSVGRDNAEGFELDACHLGSQAPVFPQEVVGRRQFPTKTDFLAFVNCASIQFVAPTQRGVANSLQKSRNKNVRK